MKTDARSADPRRLMDMVQAALFEEIPFNVAVIDRGYNIAAANSSFTRRFGDWQGRSVMRFTRSCTNHVTNVHRLRSSRPARR